MRKHVGRREEIVCSPQSSGEGARRPPWVGRRGGEGGAALLRYLSRAAGELGFSGGPPNGYGGSLALIWAVKTGQLRTLGNF
jgi:hypothetical protein